jgi:predicted AlkP superfamily pyrophosphatase or phosphodiesterase
VVLISIDGFLPGYYLRPEELGVKVSNLEALKHSGSWAEGVIVQYPSLTLPSHATLSTGVRPAKHGIVENTAFDPLAGFPFGFDKASALKAPTLWDGAKEQGLITAGISWPATLESSMNYVIATGAGPGQANPGEYYRRVSTPGLIDEIVARFGTKVLEGHAEFSLRDAFTACAASYVLSTYRPNLMMLYFGDTDHEQHEFGIHSPEAKRAYERTDEHIGEIVEAARRAGILETTTFLITGDHGFAPQHSMLQPNVLLRKAGLLRTDPNGKITDWEVVSHNGAIRLKDPSDTELLQRTRRLFSDLASNSFQDIFRIVEREELDSLGAYPEAVFMLEPELGYSIGNGFEKDEFLVASRVRAGHGYLPSHPEMRTGLVVSGPGIKKGVQMPTARQIDIAPTIARLLGFHLAAADGIPMEGLLEDSTHVSVQK